MIEQTKGVLMAQHGITADEAFQRLVRRSQDTNTKLRDVARAVLDGLRRDQLR
ncbi:ANTAR domain-containing protein [Actinoallomurus sp. NBC_01490]|uniref:ANTAR domain-containing protein n=1 Tax=Actinoallomurus sp. NBC_01490 TaxID=2903557 RepID=UPI002E33741D|nr:ANTAR domain-containing protein [Actinoallomurus sp. NBC_01490]